MSFKELGVAKWLCENLSVMAIHKPSAVQTACIPAILDSRNCIGGAKTGSGKTIAFAAPMLTQWSRDPYAICGLVLTPTRELAIQIAEQFRALGASANIRVCVVVGGTDMVKQALELQQRPHFVIATPGRLADHIQSSGQDTVCGLKRIKYLVLDEADRLLDKSLSRDLGVCINALPEPGKRQTLLFTATLTDEVLALKNTPPREGAKPTFVHDSGLHKEALPSTLEQTFMLVPNYVKLAYLYAILTCEENEKKTAVVFLNRTRGADEVRRTLQHLHVRAASLHSQMPQSERFNALGRFRAGAARVLVATDVASRGLDIPSVELVVNFDIPANADDYIHRVGRTARAGRAGLSISLVGERDVERIESIEERTRSKLEEYKTITDSYVVENALKKVGVAKRKAVIDMDKEHFGSRKKSLKAKAALA